MTRQAFLNLVGSCSAVAALLAAAAAAADPPRAKPDAPGKDAGAEHRREAERLVGGIELEVLSDGKWSKVKRIEKPLLLYGDPTRGHDRGSVWGWGETGRPVALLELFQNVADRQEWVFTVCNTSGKKVRASRGGAAWWGENDSAAELRVCSKRMQVVAYRDGTQALPE